MAVIAKDSPVQEKVGPANLPEIAVESPTQEEGFPTDKSKIFIPDCNVDQDLDKKPLPPPEVITEPTSLLSVQKKRKKRRQRKQKSKKKTVVVIKGPRAKRIFSGTLNLKLPKKAVRNGILFIALCAFFQYQLAHSGEFMCTTFTCITVVPVSDVPVTLNHNNQNVILRERTPCPEKVHVFKSCAVCFKEKSQLEIVCSPVVARDLWIKDRNRNGDLTLVKISFEAIVHIHCCLTTDCDHFTKKSLQHQMHKLEKLSSRVTPKGTEIISFLDVYLCSSYFPLVEICSIAVSVTDFPIVIKKNDHDLIFEKSIFCPERVDLQKNCSVCFMNQSVLEITCRKHGDEDYGLMFVECGNGRGTSILVEMNAEECHKNGNTSTENIQAGSKGTSWRDPGIFVIPLIFSVIFTSGFV
ncbi:hypothetical protein PRIEUP_LOCUS362 [Pristimantis euphronides]